MTAGGDEKNDAQKKEDNVALIESHTVNVADTSRVSFLTSEDDEARIRLALDRGTFVGFTKEELQKFEKDPGWRRLRLILLILFWVAWGLLLVAAVLVIVFMDKCPERPNLQWPERQPIYQIHVPSFRVGSKCSQAAGNAVGNVDGVIDVLNAPGDANYFDRLKPADIYWLRGAVEPGAAGEGPVLNANVAGNLNGLFEFAKKKSRRVLLDLPPFKRGTASVRLRDLNCGLLSGAAIRDAENTESLSCIDSDADVDKMIDFIHKNRNSANGFVLGYSQYLLEAQRATPTGKTPLEKLVDAVSRGPSGETLSGDNAKHLFFRFPVLDSRYVSGSDRQTLIERRVREEEIVRNASIRVVIETVAMNPADANACSSADCLTKLIPVVQSFNSKRFLASTYRAFAIDDPAFKYRTRADEKDLRSAEALAAFAIAALPGTPVILYGAEIGMTSSSTATDVMQWTDRGENTCADASSTLCFCNKQCVQPAPTTSAADKPAPTVYGNRSCDFAHPAEPLQANVRAQIRDESHGLFRTYVELLTARQSNDSLLWGNASQLYVDQSRANAARTLVVVRQANAFERFGLFVSLAGANPALTETVPHLPEALADACFQTVYSNQAVQGKAAAKQRFSQMVLRRDEVRLVRVFRTCSASALAASWASLLFAIVAGLMLRR